MLSKFLVPSHIPDDSLKTENKEGYTDVGIRSKTVIGETFTWSHYPILENVLRVNMEEYYNMR